jgi:hypothetical protein
MLSCRQVCTLADLDAYLAQQHKVASYNDLCMGPLLAHELVLANFRPPSHVVEIPQVSRSAECAFLLSGSWVPGCAPFD